MKSNFVRKVDKSEIPVCNILGVNIAAINMEWILNYLDKKIAELSGDYITVANVFTTVTAYDNPDYMEIQNGGVMAVPDGGPLSVVGRKRGFPEMSRVAGPNLMEELFLAQERLGFSYYFYGSSEETIVKLQENLKEKYPNVKIAGMYSPPFRPLTSEEDAEVIEKINQAGADIVFVGLGAPKQEQWMAAHQGKVNGLMIGVGAGFDYFAGNIKRAPEWMQKHSLEWLYRLMQEPTRLFNRYLRTNTKFIWNVIIRGR